jgi:hypothetical protein
VVLNEAANAAVKLSHFDLATFDTNTTVGAFKTAHGLIESIFKLPKLNVSHALYMTEFLTVEPLRSSRAYGLRSRMT